MKRHQILFTPTVLSFSVLFSCACLQAVAIDSTGSGDWHEPATWGGGPVPGGGDDARILNGHTVTVNEVLTTYSVANLTIQGGGVLTHTANNAAEDYKVIFNIAANLTIDAGGAIDASHKGHSAGNGPGSNGGRGGAAHGGEGGFGHQASTTRSLTYGSITNPVRIGSGATSQIGGGAIILTVGHSLTNNGTITAEGEGEATTELTGGGSGGSVNIETATIAGTGTITADGGEGETGNAGGGGGGGRVAVRLTGSGATFGSFSIANITARGGPSGSASNGDPSAAGTVWLKTPAQTYGDLIVRNIDVNASALTLITNGTHQFDSITTTNYGVFAPGGDAVLNLTGTTLHSDSVISNITSRIVIGHGNSSITWPSSFSNSGTLSWEGTNKYAMTTDLTIASGGILTHEVSNSEDDKLNLSITGDLTIDAGGAIDVFARGYPPNTGPGTAPSRAGAGHGGEGGDGYSNKDGGTTYGSITEPVTHGSGSVWAGGGAIILEVSGSLTNNGQINAEGAGVPNVVGGGAAGGSINIRAATLSGSGFITANGHEGESNNAGGGGAGGRVAIRLTQSGATFSSFGIDNISAIAGKGGPCCGTTKAGAGGTIYLKTADESQGSLIVDATFSSAMQTLIPANLTDTALHDIILKNEANVSLPTGQSFTVYGSWSNAASSDAFSGGGSVVFAGAATGAVYGSSMFEILTVSTAGKELQFEAGTTNTVTKEITLQGSAVNDVFLRSTHSGTQWGLNVDASVSSKTFQYLDVKDSDALPGTAVSALDSEDSGNNSNWVFSEAGLTNTWTGASSSTWSDGGNWSLGAAPSLDDAKVVIPTGAPLYPILDGPVDITELEMQASTTLSINNQVLIVNGNASIAGTLTAAGSETITFNADLVFTGSGAFTAAQSMLRLGGTEPVTFTPLSNTFYALEIANSNTVTVTDGFTVGDLTFPSTSATVAFGAGFTANNMSVVVTEGATLTFTAGQTYTVNEDLHLRGASGMLIDLSAGGSWNLNVNGFAAVRYVGVINSDASGGRRIYAVDSINNGSNPNWDFGLGKLWAGTTDNWGSISNWAPVGVPGATNHVIVDGSASTMPRLTNATTIAGLTLVGLGAPATLNVDMPFGGADSLTVSGHADIRTNARLTHTAGNETVQLAMTVVSNLTIDAGGAIDVSDKGFAAGQGPGSNGGRGGASHGGEGGFGFQAITTHPDTYGSVINPVRAGSGAGSQIGGGVVILTVGGALANNGTIAANGEGMATLDTTGGGSGGSVNITAGTLVGSGVVSANGGEGESGNAGGGGGGGRVSVHLSQGGATFAAFAVANITAFGGVSGTSAGGDPSAAGTVYLETQAQGSGKGTVTINTTVNGDARTPLPPVIDASLGELSDATVILTNQASVLSTTNVTIGDILIYANSFWTLTNWTLMVDSREHSLEDHSDPEPGATNRVDHYDQILWIGVPGGMVLEFH
jgi:hypothetical protein